jgi:hypothetical protein
MVGKFGGGVAGIYRAGVALPTHLLVDAEPIE